MSKFCPKCGNQLSDNVKFCSRCGSKVEAKPTAPQQPVMPMQQPTAPKNKKSPVKAIIAVILVIAILAGGGIAAWKLDLLPFGAKTASDNENKNIEDKDIENEGESNSDKPSGNTVSGGTLSVGEVCSYVTFGKYEQDNDISNGKEDIEWLVLAKENGKALLTSKYLLDCQKYNEENNAVTWETCTLRTWLNDTFINEAFSSFEQSKISETTVIAEKNSRYDTDPNPGNDTKDKVFLLSEAEVNKYFASAEDRKCEATEYAVFNGVWVNKNNCGYWWLRTPGGLDHYACHVYDFGNVSYDGNNVNSDDRGVRPALWVNL